MYPYVLAVHNIVRWVALILGILAVVRAYIGWLRRQAWIPADNKIGSWYTIALDIQFLLGLLLFLFFSQYGLKAYLNFGFGYVMQQPEFRFFGFEHALYMILAVVFGHLGRVFSRKAEKPADKHRRAAIWYTLSVLLILFGMPWGRPVFPTLR